MPFRYQPANIFHVTADAVVIPVNCVGTLGAGLARAAKNAWPHINPPYVEACRNGTLRPGTLLHVPTAGTSPSRILLLPTKNHWSNPSSPELIRLAGESINSILLSSHLALSSVAIPRLGRGLGGMQWNHVHQILLHTLAPAARRKLILFLAHQPSTSHLKP